MKEYEIPDHVADDMEEAAEQIFQCARYERPSYEWKEVMEHFYNVHGKQRAPEDSVFTLEDMKLWPDVAGHEVMAIEAEIMRRLTARGFFR